MTKGAVDKRTLIKSSFWYTTSMFLTKAIGFITVPVFTRLMTKEQYGDFAVFSSWQAILLIFCSIELYGTLNRARFDYSGKQEFDGYITSCLSLCTLITGVLFGSYLVFPHIFDSFFLLDRKYMFVMFAYLFTVPALNMFQTKQRIEYRYKTSSAISIIVAVLSPVLAIILVKLMRDGDALLGRIIGQFSLYIVFGIIFYIYFLFRSKKISFSCWKYALYLGLPLVFSYLGSRILLSSDLIILKHMCSATEVSYLSVTHSTSHIVLILVQTLNLAWSPWLYDMLKAGNNREIKKIYKIYLWMIIIATAVVLFMGPEVIRVLGGAKYRDSVYVLPPNILCGVFTVLTAHFVNIETYYNKPRYAAILTCSVAVLNVVLDIIGVKLFGYMAVCYVTVLCQILLIGLHYLVTRSMGIRKILSVKTVIAALAATLALIPVSLLLYQNDPVRYIVFGSCVAAVLVIVVLKRKELINTVKKFRKPKKEVQADA